MEFVSGNKLFLSVKHGNCNNMIQKHFVLLLILMINFTYVHAQILPLKTEVKFIAVLDSDSVPCHIIHFNDSVRIELVQIMQGVFSMGSENGYDNEKPVRRVKLNDFYIGRFEVTQRLWRFVMGGNPAHFNECRDCPVEMITYFESMEFIQKINQLTGLNFRLPTEAEWEYAASGGGFGKRTKYSGSLKINEVAWFGTNSGKSTHPVGTKMPNAVGIYDMSGNVYEWTQDWMGKYRKDSQNDPKGPEKGRMKVIRGGCWYDTEEGCRIKSRVEMKPNEKNGCLGLRLVHDHPIPMINK